MEGQSSSGRPPVRVSECKDGDPTKVTYLIHTVPNLPEWNFQSDRKGSGEVYGHIIRKRLWMTCNSRLGSSAMRAIRESGNKGSGEGGEQQCHFQQHEGRDDHLHKEKKAGIEEEDFRVKNHSLQAHNGLQLQGHSMTERLTRHVTPVHGLQEPHIGQN